MLGRESQSDPRPAAPSGSPVPLRMIRTKIVATLGPAVADAARIRALLIAGVDVCRFNFSHGTLQEHETLLHLVREQAADLDLPIATLGDLGGPKIRLGEVDEANEPGGMLIDVGDPLTVVRHPVVGRGGVVSTSYPAIVDDVGVGDRLLIEDGLLRFVCVGKTQDHLSLQCSAGGVLKSRKGVNLPNTSLTLPSITEHDWECVEWAARHGLDYLSLSFLRRARDLVDLRHHLAKRSASTLLVAKIEKAEAVRDFDGIVLAADAVMVARGDLGVELDVARVPIIQKDLIRRARRAGKPVIVATQMLQSMVEHSSPTRAEVSDVANAVFDGADALMLSGETSIGRFPVGAVHTMAHVAGVTEQYLARDPGHTPYARAIDSSLSHEPAGDGSDDLGHAAAHAARRMVDELACRLVVVYSKSGETARLFAKQRFPVPVVALSDDPRVLRQVNLHYGVLPLAMPLPPDVRRLIDDVDACLQERELAAEGDRIVLVAGRALGAPGSMNGILVHIVGTPTEES